MSDDKRNSNDRHTERSTSSNDGYTIHRSSPTIRNSKVRGGSSSSSVWEEGVKRAGSQRERDGGDSFLTTADGIRQQYHTAFGVLKHTRSSYKPAIYMDIGLSFDASSEVYGGRDLALAVTSGKLMGGRGSVFGEGVKRAGPQRERDGGDSFLATTDTSIKQQYRTAFCALKHTRSSYEPAIYMDSGLSFGASSGVHGGGGLGPCGWKWQGYR